MKASSGASCSVKAVATVTVGNVSDEVQFVYSIPITKGVGNQNVVTIVSGDDKYFAIREKGRQCRSHGNGETWSVRDHLRTNLQVVQDG
ncbi:hypothetical protein NIB75_07290 [Bacteroides uniformis]|nr:hypothetical protein [Bacteroides uniformis]